MIRFLFIVWIDTRHFHLLTPSHRVNNL